MQRNTQYDTKLRRPNVRQSLTFHASKCPVNAGDGHDIVFGLMFDSFRILRIFWGLPQTNHPIEWLQWMEVLSMACDLPTKQQLPFDVCRHEGLVLSCYRLRVSDYLPPLSGLPFFFCSKHLDLCLCLDLDFHSCSRTLEQTSDAPFGHRLERCAQD